MKFSVFTFIGLVVLLPACRQPYSQQTFPKTSTQKIALPNALPISKSLRSKIESATHIRELLSFASVTQLGNLETFEFAQLSKAFKIGNHWVCFDSYSQRIVLTDETGLALKLVGNLGQGPGEYDRISDVFPIWGDHIAVTNFGKLDIFDQHGNYVQEIEIRVGSETFHSVSQLVWDDPQTIVIADFPSRTRGMPAHGIFKYDGQQFTKHAAFGNRFQETLEPINGIPMATNILSRIENHLWTHNPYRSEFLVYDLNGHLIKTLPIFHPDTRSEEDFKDLRNPQDVIKHVNDTFGGYKVFRVGPIIMAFYVGQKQMYCNIYDTAGTLLRRHLPCHAGLILPTQSQDNTLYYQSDSASHAHLWQKLLSSVDLARLQAEGINTSSADGPPFIWEAVLE